VPYFLLGDANEITQTSADFRFIINAITFEKVFGDKFSAKNQPGVPMARPRGLKTRDSNSPMILFKSKLPHHCHTIRDFSVVMLFFSSLF